MEDNTLWELLNEEVTKTVKAIDNLITELSEEFFLITHEEKREEILLRKYWLLNLQDRLNKIATNGRHAGIEYHHELKQKIKSAIDNEDFESFNYFYIHAKYQI